jgi:hypothetical protein
VQVLGADGLGVGEGEEDNTSDDRTDESIDEDRTVDNDDSDSGIVVIDGSGERLELLLTEATDAETGELMVLELSIGELALLAVDTLVSESVDDRVLEDCEVELDGLTDDATTLQVPKPG